MDIGLHPFTRIHYLVFNNNQNPKKQTENEIKKITSKQSSFNLSSDLLLLLSHVLRDQWKGNATISSQAGCVGHMIVSALLSCLAAEYIRPL